MCIIDWSSDVCSSDLVNLDKSGFELSKNQMFWLTALPALSGATLRIVYSFLVPVFGGRRWTASSTATLLIPALGMGFALQDSTTSYPTLLVLALLCGFGEDMPRNAEWTLVRKTHEDRKSKRLNSSH